MADEVGTYEVQGQKIWPLASATTVAAAMTPPGPLPIVPNAPNSVVLGTFGILNLLVLLPVGSPVKRKALAATVVLPKTISGAGVKSASMVATGDVARVCFAVKLAKGATDFTGTLKLKSTVSGKTVNAEIPIKLQANAVDADGVLAFGMIGAKKAYTWIQLKAVDAAGPVVSGATVTLRYLRDNATVQTFNREFPLTTTTSGNVGHDAARIKLCVPVDWPVVFDLRQANFVRRAHMIEIKAANATGHHNRNPTSVADAKLTTLKAADLSKMHFVLDPGHGVAYAKIPARRSQEWLGAFRTAQRIRELLRDRHKVPDANIRFIRSAGIGLIEPGNVDSGGAPEAGGTLFTIDLNKPRTLHSAAKIHFARISSLLLTQHDDTVPFKAIQVTPAARQSILDANKTIVDAMVARQVAALHGRTLVADSLHWDETRKEYLFDTAPPPGAKATATRTHVLEAVAADVFPVTDAMLKTLADRTARWSLNREVAGAGGGTAYGKASQGAMIASGALTEMAQACLQGAAGPHKTPFPKDGNLAALFTDRQKEMQGISPRPDVLLTLHHNAVNTDGQTGRGFALLIADKALWSEDHLRLQKTFLKYVTALDTGLNGTGILGGHDSRMTGPDPNKTASRYAFFETEFMNSPREDGVTGFNIERLLESAFINKYAGDIVEAIVEFLLDQQDHASIDPVDLGVKVGVTPLKKGTVQW